MAALVLALAGSVVSCAEEKPRVGFVDKVYVAGAEKSKYVVFVPYGYRGDNAYPAILFLHGLGQSGTDGRAQAGRGLAAGIRKRAKSFPFITVFPQSQHRSWRADSKDGRRALAILDEVRRAYKVDPRRIYLTGYSMGGEGTFSLAAAHPRRWAAIVPICGSAPLKLAPKLKRIPCWGFIGDADAPTTVYAMRRMMVAIKKAGGQPIYQEFPGVGHRCWHLVYEKPDVFEWMLMQRRERN